MEFLITFLVTLLVVFVVAIPFAAIIGACFLFAAWLDSRETRIEPIVSDGGSK